MNDFVSIWNFIGSFLCLCLITVKIRVTVTMRVVIVFLLSALLPHSLSHQPDPLAWVYTRRSQGHYYGSLQADTAGGACPDECDCPPTFPIAMYCDGRGLSTMPTIPSRVKYAYLQNNAITAVPDSTLANATNLVWLMMHHNQLTSDAIGKKVSLHLVSVTQSHACEYEGVMLVSMDVRCLAGGRL